MILSRVGPIKRAMDAFLEWIYHAQHDATLMALYSGLISWGDIPVDEPIVLHEVAIEPTTNELHEIIITDNE